LNFFRKPPNNTLWKIPTENSVGDSLCDWHDEQCSQFTDEITEGFYRRKIPSVFPSVIPSVNCEHIIFFFCFVLNFFSHGNSVGIYRGNIFVGKISRKFTDKNISSVFPFVFINFLVVIESHILKSIYKLIKINALFWIYYTCVHRILQVMGTRIAYNYIIRYYLKRWNRVILVLRKESTVARFPTVKLTNCAELDFGPVRTIIILLLTSNFGLKTTILNQHFKIFCPIRTCQQQHISAFLAGSCAFLCL